jgi:hypothetical protein
MAKNEEVYEWRNNNACVATYNVLEGETFLDQFEDVDIPFDEAPDVTMAKLRYFPKSTGNPNLLDVLGNQMARKFLKHVSKTFTLQKQTPGKKTADFIEELSGVFSSKSGTLRDLAEILDDNVKFPDEN